MNDKGRSGQMNLGNSGFLPKEDQLETRLRFKSLSIGLPGDNRDDEKRIPLTPEAASLLVNCDNEVVVYKGAGTGANYSDKDYTEYGAIVTDSLARVYSCDVVIKVAPFTEKETDFLKGNQVVMSYLNVLKLTEETLARLIKKKVTAIAFEKIGDSNGVMPVIESMSEISGVTSILIASDYLSNHHGGKGVMLGGITGITPT
jgi:alanine dehydrogenase